MDSNVYIEDNTISLPILKNGVTRIGDLWDCHSSAIVEENLFTEYLDGQYVTASSINNENYQLVHSKSTSDMLKTFKVAEDISLEVMSGLISMKGSGDYKNDGKSSTKVEKLVCIYEKETYCVSAEIVSKKVMNQEIIEKIINKKLRATHFVRSVTLGAEVRANIQVSNRDKKSFTDFSGDFLRKLALGRINPSTKANLIYLDNEYCSHLQKEINVHSKPTMNSQPKDIEEMFQMIENINSIVEKERHFQLITNQVVIGVPIRFQLVPIKQFLDFDVEKLYIKMSDEVMQKFNEMLIKIHDYQTPNIVSREVLNRIPGLIIILNDEMSGLSSQIREYEKTLKDICDEYFEKAINIFKLYKVNKVEEVKLLEIVDEFESKCNSTEIDDEVIKFARQGEGELRSVRWVDIQESRQYIEVLTSQNKLDNFTVGDQEVKVLLFTDHDSSQGVFQRYYGIAKSLKEKSLRIGVAVQSISPNFQLVLKVNGIKHVYDVREEIPFILSIIGATVGIGSRNELLFHSLNAEYFNARIPLETKEEFVNLNHLIDNLKKSKIKIANTYSETHELLTKSDDRFKCFIPIDTIETSYTAIRNLNNLISTLNSPLIDWIVGNLDINIKQEAGFLYVVKNSKVIAICLDDYDIELFTELYRKKGFEDMESFAPKQMDYSFYPNRVITSILIMESIEISDYKAINFNSIGLKHFSEPVDQNILNALQLMSAYKSKTIEEFVGILATFALNERKELNKCLVNSGFNITDSTFNRNILSNESKQTIIAGIEEVLQSSNQLNAKISIAINEMKGWETIPNDELNEFALRVNKLMDSIIADENSPKNLLDAIETYDNDNNIKLKCQNMLKILEKFETENENNTDLHLKSLYSVLKNENQSNVNNTLLKYINLIDIDAKVFGSVKESLIEKLNKGHFYQMIADLSKISHGVKYFKLHKGLEDVCGNNDKCYALQNLIRNLSNTNIYGEKEWQELWKNNRFVILMRSMIDDNRITGSLLSMGCETSTPRYIPEDIGHIIDNNRIDYSDMDLTKIINNFNEFHEILKEMVRRNTIPMKFRTVLAESVLKNMELKNRLDRLGITRSWKWRQNLFTEVIDIQSIRSTLKIIDEDEEKIKEEKHTHESNGISFHMDFTDKQDSYKQKSKVKRSLRSAPTHDMIKVFGENPEIITPKRFLILNRILERPSISGEDTKPTVIQVIPYIMQKIKMWGCRALTADSVALMIANKQISKKPIASTRPGRPGNAKTNEDSLESSPKTAETTPLTRWDIITGIFNNVDPIVGHDVLNIMAKFPMALPLIVQGIYEEKSFKVLIPWLTQSTIKWETSPGEIVENNLFIDHFKLIVALRIGDVEPGHSGKSTLLNQLFSERNVFSCCGEPGAKRNRPISLEGSVEMVCLTQESASNSLWDSTLNDYYKSGKNEVILLANLHGNALDYPDHLNLLKTMASSYLLFVMPNNTEDLNTLFDKVEESLGLESGNDQLYYVGIDPKNRSDFDENLIIKTSKISDDSNIENLRNVFECCLTPDLKIFNSKSLESFGCLNLCESIETVYSNNLISFVRLHSCEDVKESMKLQKVGENNFFSKCNDIWNQNGLLRELIWKFGGVLMLDIDSRQKAIVHLEKELGILSAKESMTARTEYKYAQQEYQKIIGAKSEDEISLVRWRLRINEALEKIDNISLGLEHLSREIGILYNMSLLKNPNNNSFMKLAQSYADLLIAGQAIELLDGDSSTISGPWLSAICHNVCQKVPKLKIFVVSIIGLQSSGKSTLLNAMFASKFAVSVGRCTRGLFMRLLFIDEEMKRDMKLKFDALLLIDTEGLGAPERQNEPDSEKKDRVMATFAMGISHLTIINVLGEYINNLTEILQIAIISMARLEKVDISPDILMVQHLTERNSDKMTNATKQFSDALENAINMADHKDLSLGVRNSNCLKILRKTISMGKLFRQFRPFKNGATANSPPSEEYHQDVIALYNSIIETAQFSDKGHDFNDWSQSIQNYWESIKDENFMRFKDVKELQSFLDTSEKIVLVKESIDSCFKEHSELKLFLNESANKINKNVITREKVLEELRNKFNGIPNNCPSKPACDCCLNFLRIRNDFYLNLEGKPNELDVKTTIEKYISATKEYYIKYLTQKLSAVAIRQVESDETFCKIETQLKKHLKIKTKFNEMDIQNITEEIMGDLEREANEKVIQVDVISEIKQEIQSVYHDMTLSVDNVKPSNMESLRHVKAFDAGRIKRIGYYLNLCEKSKCLSDNLCYQLEGKLKSTARHILKVEKIDTYRRGMVQKMDKRVNQILGEFEELENIKLISNFKWKAIEYTIKHFMEYMSEQQDNWNKDNNPLIVLQNNKEKYLKWIGDKLRYGFGYYSDGSEAGVNILRAIIQKAIKVANDRKEQEFNSQTWISNAFRIRLKYFGELVDDIKNNKLDSSLEFFNSPKYHLEQWYKNRLTNCLSHEDLMDIYKVNQQKLMEIVEKRLEELDSIEEKQKFIKEFVSDCDEIDLRFPDSAFETTRAETDMFDRGMNEAFERERKQMFSNDKIQFVDLTKDKRLFNRLGCTESCPYCSAICWMHRGHESNVDETKKHHTCHQPMGLKRIHYNKSNILNVDPCHNQNHVGDWCLNDDTTVSFLNLIKMNGYIDKWKFEAHTDNQFNELMCWFFFKLHKEMAKRYGLKPADDQHLRYYKMDTIEDRIDVIMMYVKDKVYNKQ